MQRSTENISRKRNPSRFLKYANSVVQIAVRQATNFTDEHHILVKRRGAEKIVASVEKLGHNGPGLGFEFIRGSNQICIGPYISDGKEAFLDRKKTRLDQVMINQVVKQYLDALGI